MLVEMQLGGVTVGRMRAGSEVGWVGKKGHAWPSISRSETDSLHVKCCFLSIVFCFDDPFGFAVDSTASDPFSQIQGV